MASASPERIAASKSKISNLFRKADKDSSRDSSPEEKHTDRAIDRVTGRNLTPELSRPISYRSATKDGAHQEDNMRLKNKDLEQPKRGGRERAQVNIEEMEFEFPDELNFDLFPELPEKYEQFTLIKDFTQIEVTYQDALTAFQNCFVDQMVSIEKSYMFKLSQLREFKRQTATNHKFANAYLKDQFAKVKAYRANILIEKVEWERDRDLLFSKFKSTFSKNGLVSLDVGGSHRIKTNLDLLTEVKGSLLAKMFSGRHEIPINEKGNVFIDRDGETFLTLVNYLRNRKSIPKFDSVQHEELFLKELQFWEMQADYEKIVKVISSQSKARHSCNACDAVKGRGRSESPGV